MPKHAESLRVLTCTSRFRKYPGVIEITGCGLAIERRRHHRLNRSIGRSDFRIWRGIEWNGMVSLLLGELKRYCLNHEVGQRRRSVTVHKRHAATSADNTRPVRKGRNGEPNIRPDGPRCILQKQRHSGIGIYRHQADDERARQPRHRYSPPWHDDVIGVRPRCLRSCSRAEGSRESERERERERGMGTAGRRERMKRLNAEALSGQSVGDGRGQRGRGR
ncbi:hypothetical protein MPTK1_1g08500 [Marchantia polymorpha subsp. ruderalis]|uniref:Uncharacterized protein n=2 Tax=Marchantia polymorpha TaxID=3197 RepID=A0AAF6AMY8_MARPO|nr:hypothetical protein MARPO_0036s0093 [Marchantia polymorpha]BBM97808.1 hypothetical protein Mp_1g08500 [Marchantia polymorpha subsp. ruderalis]|eukprot:PTQ41110.1 hypothetical protein MARPO_0036s0093 [Marchantia polymorpha]